MNMLVSLDIVALFTSVPLEVTLELLMLYFPAATVKIFEFMLKFTYFSYRGDFYEKGEGVAIGSPLSTDKEG